MSAKDRNPLPIVIVDANAIVHGAWWLDSPAWKVLLHQASSGHIRLLVPELVVREAVGRFAAEANARQVDVDRAARKLHELTGDEPPSVPGVPLADTVSSYESALRGRLNEFNCPVIALPTIDLTAMVQRAIERRKPFDAKGSGFRDAILWETILGVMREHEGSSVVLISKDARAFADSPGGQLNGELEAELSEREVPGTLELLENPIAYLDRAGITDPHWAATLFEAVQAQQYQLVDQAEAALQGHELVSDWPRARFHIESADETDVVLDRASRWTEQEGLSLVHIAVETRARVQLRLEGRSTPLVREVTVPLAVTGTATYDPADGHIADLRLELPSAAAVGEVVQALEALEPSFLPALQLSETIEAYRRATSSRLPAETLELFRRAASPVPPETLELFRRAATLIPSETLEAFRRLAGSPV